MTCIPQFGIKKELTWTDAAANAFDNELDEDISNKSNNNNKED